MLFSSSKSKGDIKLKRRTSDSSEYFSVLSSPKSIWIVRLLAIAAVISGVATYIAVVHSSGDFGPDPEIVLGLVLIDLILLLTLAAIITWKITSVWIAKWKGSLGSRLQTRIIVMFSLVSIVPTIIVAVFSVLFFNYGIQSWFDDRVGTALEESNAVAEGYLLEHKENIRADVLAMANDINNQAPALINNPAMFKKFISTQAAIRSLTEAIIFQRSNILAKTDLSFSLMFELERLPPDVLDRAANGEVVVLTSDRDDRVRALIKINNLFDTYLLVGRFVDSKVLKHIEVTKGSVSEYKRLKSSIFDSQLKFSFAFVAVALIMLLVTVWVSMIFAGELVGPIKTLISATERVKAGDLKTRVSEGPRNDEIGTLGRAFNRMTSQLKKHREELVEVNKQTDERRRLNEAVLSGVSAGVIALDSKKLITLFNKRALKLLSINSDGVYSEKPLSSIFPEAESLLKKAESSSDLVVKDEISIIRDNRKSTFLTRIVKEEFSDAIEGYVVTFDDITDLLAAQRSAAWSDVARRIAHEIKNPLTPIALSAERLKQKYRKQIKKDPGSFDKYIDTITRHVTNMGNIVEEFANFARMPSPVLKKQNLSEIIKDSVFSEKTVSPDIKYTSNLLEKDVFVNGDKGQIIQVLTNVLKNATEAIKSRQGKNLPKGKIDITLKQNEYTEIEIEDNGMGFPDELIDRITEPYVTTRDRGTGLGLAIVKKVMSDHDGTLFVNNVIDGKGRVKGAVVALSFPLI